MKYTIQFFSLVFTLVTFTIVGQNNLGKTNDLERIHLNTYISQNVSFLPAAAKGMLNNKLKQIASKNGVGGDNANTRFIITSNITLLSKDITPTAPPMTALEMEVSFFIGDGREGTLFSTTSIIVKGVGTNETRAYISALKRIKPGSQSIKSFIQEGKSKIISYYNSRCDFIIKEATSLVNQNKFEAAIYKLTSVPQVCKDCYIKCLDEVGPIYQMYIDRECKKLLAKASHTWNSGYSISSAKSASTTLSYVDPSSACFQDALVLSGQIGDRMKELDDREWEFRLKEWDLKLQEIDFNQQNEAALNEIEISRINAYNEVGETYNKEQPEESIFDGINWW
ncbi:MAG: hypothetical protein COB98_07990 [Flavobacteriaceae bacterium]|nr:MAG: hypothetical protein COB98_07990 [Flavobacteriaceae bacterium]